MPRSPSRPPRNKTASKTRIAAQRGGHWGETLVALFLQCQCYRIIDRRFKTPVGEIDLVAARWGTTVFVEVKARQNRRLAGETLEAVNQRRIARAAQYYIARHPELAQTPLRFDVIFLARWSWPRHVINAFDALD